MQLRDTVPLLALATHPSAVRGEICASRINHFVLGDVEIVVDGFEETDQYSRFDFEPTMLVSVFRTGDQSAVEIADLATRYVEWALARPPEGVAVAV